MICKQLILVMRLNLGRIELSYSILDFEFVLHRLLKNSMQNKKWKFPFIYIYSKKFTILSTFKNNYLIQL